MPKPNHTISCGLDLTFIGDGCCQHHHRHYYYYYGLECCTSLPAAQSSSSAHTSTPSPGMHHQPQQQCNAPDKLHNLESLE